MTKEILIRRFFSLISINLRDECDYNIFFTRKKTNLILSDVKSDCEPPVQLSVALETFLDEVKLELASIEFDKPKDNISTGERQAAKELSRKGKHHRIDEQTGQTNEGQVLLDGLNNYRPLDKPMVETTTKKAQPLI